MKRAIQILICLASSVAAFAEPAAPASAAQHGAPDAELRICAPKRLFAELTQIFRTATSDPQAEMRLSLALMFFGYPNFNGISQNADAAALFYGIDTDSPITAVALKTDGTSKQPLALQALKSSQFEVSQLDDYAVAVSGAGKEFAAYAELAKAAAEKNKLSSLAEITLRKNAIGALPFAKPQIFRDAESARVKISHEPPYLAVSLEIKFKEGTESFALAQSAGREKFLEEALVIPQRCDFAVISKTRSPNNSAAYAEILSSFAPPEDAKKLSSLLGGGAGTFAIAANFGENLSFACAEKTAMAQADLEKLAREIAPLLRGASGESAAACENIKIGEIPCVKTDFPEPLRGTLFSSVWRGYLLSACDAETLGGMLKSCESPAADFPLSKYARADCDIAAVLNNSSLIGKLLQKRGAKLKDGAQIDDTALYANASNGTLKIFTRIDLRILGCYLELFSREKKK